MSISRKRVSIASSSSNFTYSSSSLSSNSENDSTITNDQSISYHSSNSSQLSILTSNQNKLNKKEARIQQLEGFLIHIKKAAKSSKNNVISAHLKGMQKSLRNADPNEAKNHAQLIKKEIKKQIYQNEKKGSPPQNNLYAEQLIYHMKQNMDIDKLKKQKTNSNNIKIMKILSNNIYFNFNFH
ncbi:hypothetical protein C1645_842257 [Glomus cerebriforme]|uniref:Uncharacterized protein n=1 Tax=Glomus cerebriforme TaxID=658196 RepID=A0A397RXC0_9GLOM|nr:hypothetical protein C1645_842257 [Glomus cerebriforme]